MKTSRSGGMIFWVVFFSLSFVIFFALTGFFRAAEGPASTSLTETKALAQLRQVSDSLKTIDSAEEAKKTVKFFEVSSGLANESGEIEKVKNALAPLLGHFASKSKESEDKFLLGKKRDLMEGLVNAYRKEIPNGDIRVRAAYLNILFDLQSSLLNESDETETVFLKRNRERFGGLKVIGAASRDPGQAQRIAALESIFSVYEKGFSLGAEWRAKRAELVLGLEKNLVGLAKQIKAGDSQSVAETRRSFFFTAILSLLAILASFIALLVSQKLSRLHAESLSDAIQIVLKEYGQEGAHDQRALTILQGDREWSKLLTQILDSEAVFNSNFQALLAVPKSMKLPFLVFNKEQELVHSNDSARRFFEWREGNSTFEDLLSRAEISLRGGNKAQVLETLLKSFQGSKQENFEVLMTESGEWVPMEFIFCPITSGRLMGGKVLVIRLIPNEAARIEKAVGEQVSKVRDYVQKLSKSDPVEIQVSELDILPIRETILDLQNLKMTNEEREALWKSEISGLNDQVVRQKDILLRLTNEIRTMGEDYAQLISLVKTIRGSDESWHKEVTGIERDLGKWMDNRQRLSSDLQNHSSVLHRASEIERQIRETATGMKNAIAGFEQELADLKNYNQEVKVHAVNLSFTEDPKQKEFAARARAFSQNVGHYTEVVSSIMKNLNEFVGRHPGGSLFPHLESAEISPLILDNLKEEQMRWSNFVQRWKLSSQEILAREEQAIDLLHEVDKKNNVAIQLSETSIVINDQAKNNLGRWH